MNEKLTQLKSLLAEISDLNATNALLNWDMQVYMPHGGAEDRSDLQSTIARLIHQKSTMPEIGQLLSDLAPAAAQWDPDSDDARLLKVANRDYQKLVRVPIAWVEDFARITTLGHSAWQEARAKNDFVLFEPHLKEIVRLRREYASFFTPYDHVYDPLLDDFEPGMKTTEVQAIFNELRPAQVEIIKAIAAHAPADDSFLYQDFPEKGQWDFGVEVITNYGYDWDHGRQDKTAHPFTTGFGIGDVRITTRFNPRDLRSGLFGTMHECGHALYGQGQPSHLKRTPLVQGASMAVHESQSRLWENLVGRSLPFWKFYYAKLQAHFPAQLGNIDLQTFYRGINKVKPSFIRVEADEATYNLHIMLRLELEIAMMEGSLDVHTLPEAWNDSMQRYLGITPPTNALGVLQDIHWSGGMIGYFPTYALGNLVSAQLWETMLKDIPDVTEQFERGDFKALLEWMRSHIHQYGTKFEPQELVRKITGSGINPQPYLRYLRRKYGELYQL